MYFCDNIWFPVGNRTQFAGWVVANEVDMALTGENSYELLEYVCVA